MRGHSTVPRYKQNPTKLHQFWNKKIFVAFNKSENEGQKYVVMVRTVVMLNCNEVSVNGNIDDDGKFTNITDSARIVKNEVGVAQVTVSVSVHGSTKIEGLVRCGGGSTGPYIGLYKGGFVWSSGHLKIRVGVVGEVLSIRGGVVGEVLLQFEGG